jgi:hypothetical protein
LGDLANPHHASPARAARQLSVCCCQRLLAPRLHGRSKDSVLAMDATSVLAPHDSAAAARCARATHICPADSDKAGAAPSMRPAWAPEAASCDLPSRSCLVGSAQTEVAMKAAAPTACVQHACLPGSAGAHTQHTQPETRAQSRDSSGQIANRPHARKRRTYQEARGAVRGAAAQQAGKAATQHGLPGEPAAHALSLCLPEDTCSSVGPDQGSD